MESGLPELLIDRSLGRAAVPKWFAENWPSPVRTIDDVWGQLKVEDTEWMARCQAEGWIAVCKDGRIRRRRGERRLMSAGTMRVYLLPNGQLRRDQMVERFSQNLPAMLSVSREPGPWMYGIYADGIRSLTLYD